MNETKALQIGERTYRSLVAKCQKNGWIMKDGYPWQDDPYLEEYPYKFAECTSLEDLRRAFAHGNWAIRQGFLYDDLAFVQQVDGGDEWWTLKRVADNGDISDWLAFESWTFEPSANYRAGSQADQFTNAIRSMQMAAPAQCERLVYALPEDSPGWNFDKTMEIDFDHIPHECRSFSTQMAGYGLKVYERPSSNGFTAELFDGTSKRILRSEDGIASALDAAKTLQKTARLCIDNEIHDPGRLRDLQPLEFRTRQAAEAFRALPAEEKNPGLDIQTI